MNLWAKRTGLIILSALSFFSCDDDINTIGLDPENNLGIFFTKIPLQDNLNQVWLDSIANPNLVNNSSATVSILVGQYEDEKFGHIEAKHFSELALTSQNPGSSFDESATFDSLIFEMRIDHIYGPNNGSNSLEVYQLTDTVQLVSATDLVYHYTFSSQDLGNKIGEKTFTIDADSIDLDFNDTSLDEDIPADSAIKANYYDSNDKYIYFTRISLDETLGQDLFNKAKSESTELSSGTNFSNYFKGIALTSTAGSSIITYSPTYTRMVMYYSETVDGTTTQKRLTFPVNSARGYNNISPNKNSAWSGSDFDNITNNNTPYQLSSDYVYLQQGTGMLPIIDLSVYESFVDTIKTPVINKAEIVLENIEGLSKTTPAPSTLILYATNTASLENNVVFAGVIPASFNSSTPLTAVYDSDIKGYRIDLPHYLRSIDHGFTKNNQIVLTPSNLSLDVSRFALRKEDVYLNIYYTTPDK